LSSKKKTTPKPRKKTTPKPPPEVTADDLWIAPKSNLKWADGDRAWNDRLASPTGSRLLELADIALGLKKPEPAKKRRSASSAANSQK
jgi:hypothetical protein